MSYTLSDLNTKEALLMELAHDLKTPPARVPEPISEPSLAQLNAAGTRLWLDTGNLEEATKLWRKETSALTTNNTLANQVVQTGVLDSAIQNTAQRVRALEPNIALDELVLDVAFVINCHIALRLVSAFDAYVSVELHPAFAHSAETTFRYAQRYYAVCPERFIVKIPLTPEGYCGVAKARADGIPINFTLGFSARQNYLAALLSRPNYVNVFLGRLNAVVADNKFGDGKNVGERVTLASQNALIALRTADTTIPTHQIAASMRNAEQMVSLAGVDVYTVPPKAVAEFYQQEHAPCSITSRLGEDYAVQLNADADRAYIETLWTVDDNFKRFAKALAERGGTNLKGDDLREADRDFGTHLFTAFAAEEQTEIRTKGKIPDVARWKSATSLDNLMTESALQSFVVDQSALDSRIRDLVTRP